MINDINIDRIVISNKIPFGKKDFKYFIGHKNDKKIKLFSIFCPGMSTYKRDIDKAKCMHYLIKDEKNFDKYNEICEKVSNIVKKKVNRELVHNKKYLKAEKKINTNKGFHCISKPVILIDLVF